ncbi:hypothetical protein [Streptantibioticus ferralitis]|uniref:Uncharacterized protein n=1 Tax=Streptantibioticus ferralitis TaxID=236510 RepID=A0ABT5YYG2_9ACTN|nr:hypothetical protein [Streptantibioticus ferralitis]MDF2256646.1 hypothetical protein [Streptantibioticus ferralitis]
MSAAPKPASWELVGAPAEGLPTSLVGSCARVGHDLLHDPTVHARLPELRWWAGREAGAPAGYVVVGLRTPQMTLFGSGVNTELAEAELAARIAEITQDDLIGYEALPWPACPGHNHPMEPCAVDEEAWWCCPASHHPLSVIGQLG